MEIDPPASKGSPTPASSPAAAPTASKMVLLAESPKLEHQFLRVPFERCKKSIRAKLRLVEKEVSAVISGVSDITDSAEISSD